MAVEQASIVLLTKNSGKRFADVLRGLFACVDVAKSEIVMIDSGSTDHTIQQATQFPQIRIHRILAQDFGHGKTRNLAARLTSRPYIVFLVQDATPVPPDFLRLLLDPLCKTLWWLESSDARAPERAPHLSSATTWSPSTPIAPSA